MRYLARCKTALVKLFVITPLTLLTAQSAHGFDLKPKDLRGNSTKRSMSVLQNRNFLKAWRPEAGFVAGTVLDEAYLDTEFFGARAALFINEWMGFEVQSLKTTVSNSEDREALNDLKYAPLPDSSESSENATPTNEDIVVTPDPEVNAIHAINDFNVIAAPFYGKLNLLDQWIVYTDVYFTGGFSQITTDQGSKGSLTLGLGERFYVGDSWSFRIDFRDRIFNETRAGKTAIKHSKSVDLGASYFLN